MRFHKLYLILCSLGSVVMLAFAGSAEAQQTAISPREFAAAEAPGVADLTGFPSYRLQQVYGKSDFTHLGDGPHVITRIDWRPDGAVTDPLTYPSSRFIVKLSTTSAAPGSLSPTFADNVGADEMTAFDGPVTLTTANLGPAGGPKQFDYGLDLQSRFTYDPDDGNLLMDLTVLDGEGPLLFDWTANATESTSFYWTGTLGVDSPVAATLPEDAGGQFGGHVIQFSIVPEPSSLGLVCGVVLALVSRRRK